MWNTWEALFEQAAAFANELGQKLISVSHSADNSEGVITVWYWKWAGAA